MDPPTNGALCRCRHGSDDPRGSFCGWMLMVSDIRTAEQPEHWSGRRPTVSYGVELIIRPWPSCPGLAPPGWLDPTLLAIRRGRL